MDLMGLVKSYLPIPFPDRGRFEDEGIVEYASVTGQATYRNYREPGMRAILNITGAAWNIALTKQRFVIHWGSRTFIDLPWSDDRLDKLDVRAVRGKFLVTYRAEWVRDDASGDVEIKANVADADKLVRVFTDLRAAAVTGE